MTFSVQVRTQIQVLRGATSVLTRPSPRPSPTSRGRAAPAVSAPHSPEMRAPDVGVISPEVRGGAGLDGLLNSPAAAAAAPRQLFHHPAHPDDLRDYQDMSLLSGLDERSLAGGSLGGARSGEFSSRVPSGHHGGPLQDDAF